MKKHLTLVIMIICLFINSGFGRAGNQRRGDIVAVNPHQETILLQREDAIEEYKLALNAEINLNNKSANLKALQPVEGKNFRQARITLNKDGKISSIRAYYQQVSIIIAAVKEETIIIKDLHNKNIKEYKLRPETKVVKNSHTASLSSIKPGDRGVVILGINNQLQKLKVHHYQLQAVNANHRY